jgi:hypothetical protein
VSCCRVLGPAVHRSWLKTAFLRASCSRGTQLKCADSTSNDLAMIATGLVLADNRFVAGW